MDHNIHLMTRNAQLETELRFAKEQLNQANSANLYLLKQMSEAKLSSLGEPTRIEQQLSQVRQQNSLLKKKLRVAEKTYSQLICQSNAITARKLLQNNSKLSTLSGCDGDVEKSTKSSRSVGERQSKQRDLISLDDGIDITPNSLTSPFDASTYDSDTPDTSLEDFASPVLERAQQGDKTGLGISLGPEDVGSAEKGDSNLHNPTKSNDESGFFVERLDGSRIWLRTTSSRGVEATPENRGRPRFLGRRPLHFLDREHNRLMGAACFIESMTCEERQRHWVEYAIKNPRHNAREWKEYYENVIWPKYIQKIGPTSSEVSGLKTCDIRQIENAGDDDLFDTTDCHQAADTTGTTDLLAANAEGHDQPISSPSQEIGPSRATERLRSLTRARFAAFRSQAMTVSSGQYVPAMSPHQYDPMSAFDFPLTEEDLFYKPDEPENHRRSVLVVNITDQTQLNDLLNRLKDARSGLLSATIYPAAQMKTSPSFVADTALLIFRTRKTAVDFVEAANEYVTCTEPRENEPRTRGPSASLIESPSRPVPAMLMQPLPGSNRQEAPVSNNVLHLWGLHHEIVEMLTAEVVVEHLKSQHIRFAGLLSCHYGHDGMLILEFATVLDATRSCHDIYWKLVRGSELSIGYMVDPSTSELKQPVEKLASGIMSKSDGLTDKATTDIAENLQIQEPYPDETIGCAADLMAQSPAEDQTSVEPKLLLSF